MAWIRNRPIGLTYVEPEKVSPGFTLFCSVRGHHATLLDINGRVVHQWHHPEGIQHVKFLENGNLLIQTLPPEDAQGAEKIGGSAGALIELDWQSEVVWEYRDVFMHHDYVRLDNGNHLYLAWEKLPLEINDRVRGGHKKDDDPAVMWGDVVKEIDSAGNLLRTWRSWEFLSLEDDRICPLESRKEWTHANSLALTGEGEWLISFRLTDTVATVDPLSGEFTWKWGPGITSHQHTATCLENGNILLFDNGCHRRAAPAFSRVLEVQRKPVDDSSNSDAGDIVWSYHDETLLAFNSFMVSGAERLENGNTLITEGATGRLFEVTPAHQVVWEYVSPWTLPSTFGPTPAVFRSFRIPPDHPGLGRRKLDERKFQTLNQAIAQGVVQREPEYAL